jgi:SAM-dependent methyltransferase
LKSSLIIEVERSGNWRAAQPGARKRPKGELPAITRPLRLTMNCGKVIARSEALPFRASSIDSAICLDVLEFVRNDEGLVDEIARVLSPRGTLVVRVPATGPLAGIDAFNLMHYLVDVTRRGAKPFEISELGWRRHYSLSALESLLDRRQFRIVRVERRRLALAELVNFVGMLLFRWCRPSRDRYRMVKRLSLHVQRFENRIRTPIGSVIEITAERLDQAQNPSSGETNDGYTAARTSSGILIGTSTGPTV